MTDDQRRFTRIDYDCHAVFHVDGTDFTGALTDISLKGAMLEVQGSTEGLTNGTKGELQLDMEGANAAIVTQARCVHLEGNHVGLEFDSLDIDSAAHLRRLVEVNLGSEDLLYREVEALIQARSED